ncbi:DNA ligase 1-like [Helianthus annuus]|uniref:DNA ligase 1-like n=1 Tax=Helianthus annuus TaxID=4232 RepID=UPI000B90097D|nr:DNA ligase 1-like [Helianthus annuus]
MDNESLKQLARYHPNHPEPSTKAEFFGFIKDKNYQDPDPIEHQKWRNDEEIKEASYADELKTLASFKETRNEWLLKEEKKKRSRKTTPKVQVEEGSSSQPKRKRQKKSVETMLVDESEEEDEAECEAEVNVEGDVHLSPESAKFLKSLNEYNAEKEKTAGDEGDNEDKSSSEEEIDETERAKRIKAEIEKEKQLKRKRREDKDDELYNPSPEHVIESQTPPSSGGRKKTNARKSVVSPKAARRKLTIKLPKRTSKPKSKPSQPPSPPPEPSPPQSPHKSPPKQPTPPPSPLPHLAPPHLSPIQEQPVVTSQQIFQTPPSTQPPVTSTLGNIPHEDIGDFNFASDDQVKRLEKKVKEVLVENKKLVDREKKLEKRAEIDILKVKVAELEEEKARRDEQNKYLKNKELEAAKAMKEHEIYMMNKVLENLLGKSVEQRFEEIEVEEVRARRQAMIDAEMKNKGKGVEGVSDVSERSIFPSTVLESPVQNPRPISVVSGIFEEDVLINDVIDDEEEGGTGIKVSEASNEQNVEDYLHDDANEEPEDATGEEENVGDQNVDKREKLILRIEPEVEEGEIRHTYTMNDIIEMTRIDDPNFKFDFEEELNAFDMNQQPEYQYKYVDEADNYDRVEVEDCSDKENVNVDTSNFPTLVEFFSQENVDELRRKVVECLKDKKFDGTTKDAQREERKKWLRKSNLCMPYLITS